MTVHDLLDQFAELVAEKLERRMRASNQPGAQIDQSKSPLGRKKHCQAVRARLARGESGASVVGRKHYLTSEALEDELRRCTVHTAKRTVIPCNSVRDELDRELRLLQQGGKAAR